MNKSSTKIEFLNGQAPVQAKGTIDSKPFFFHARWDGWAFAVALDPELDPRSIAKPDEKSFYLEGDYGNHGAFDASYMSVEEAEGIIRKCIEKYLLITKEHS